MNRLFVVALAAMALSACNDPLTGKGTGVTVTSESTEEGNPSVPDRMTDSDKALIDLFLKVSKEPMPKTVDDIKNYTNLMRASETIYTDICISNLYKGVTDSVYCEKVRQSKRNLDDAFRAERNYNAMKPYIEKN